MIKGSATIQFGSGSVASVGCIDADSGAAVVFMRSVPPGKIGINTGRFDESDREYIIENPEVAIYFTNTESMDSWLSYLTLLRQDMNKMSEGQIDEKN